MASSSECARGAGVSSSPGDGGRGASGCRSDVRGLDQRFPRSRRLSARRDYLRVYAEGRRVSSVSFTIFGLPNGCDTCRIGLTVTRKIGGAVVRNRVKRRLRDIFRRHRAVLRPPLDLVVNVHRSFDDDYRRLESEFLRTFERLARRWAP